VASVVIGENREIEIGLPLSSSWYQEKVTRHHIRPKNQYWLLVFLWSSVLPFVEMYVEILLQHRMVVLTIMALSFLLILLWFVFVVEYLKGC
jgi:hypothetical protein